MAVAAHVRVPNKVPDAEVALKALVHLRSEVLGLDRRGEGLRIDDLEGGAIGQPRDDMSEAVLVGIVEQPVKEVREASPNQSKARRGWRCRCSSVLYRSVVAVTARQLGRHGLSCRDEMMKRDARRDEWIVIGRSQGFEPI